MAKPTKIYSVSQVNSLIKEVLQNNLPARFTITGEITDWKLHQSGHCYFALKDAGSQLPCVMWKSKFAKVKFNPENGMAVLVTGSIDVYPPQGKYQFYAEAMQPAGMGELHLAFEQMYKRLEAQGLFADEHKNPLPPYPRRIAILTSESGAALHDITDSIQNRWPCVKLLLYPVPVQGEGAAQKIAAALRDVNSRNKTLKIDLIILGRGGGSLEDLWAFNEEALTHAIFDSKIPVISAVGHEIDTTIADLVADARASTPTKAGVVAVPDMKEVLTQLVHLKQRLSSNAQSKLELCRKSLQVICAAGVFRNPLLIVFGPRQNLDELQTALADSLNSLLTRAKNSLSAAYEQVVRIEPHRLLGRKTVDLNSLQSRAAAAMNATINKYRLELTARENRLTALNPKAVLHRGYSITTSKKTGRLMRKLHDVELGDLIVTEVAGEILIESKVTKK